MEVCVKNVIGLLALVTLASCGQAKQSPKFGGDTAVVVNNRMIKNNIEIFDEAHALRFGSLPLEGRIDDNGTLWSGDHWPLNKGLINQRWNTPERQGFELVTPTKEELLLLTSDDVARLAPTEKFDILMGRYDYPLKLKIAAEASPASAAWEGIGNGWAIASANYPEPKALTLTNADGIVIPFGSSDVKALLSYYYAKGPNLPLAKYLGRRCRTPADEADEVAECNDDLTAAAFHVALGNVIGAGKKSIILDIARYAEVWNHPVIGYKSEVTEVLPARPNSPEGTHDIMRMKTKLVYVDESVGNSWEPVRGTYNQVTTNRVYKYDLYLDKSGTIIGSAWLSNDRPDFMWMMPAVDAFGGLFEGLPQLLAR